jgi:LPXTG-motif cell wall-anchored protein
MTTSHPPGERRYATEATAIVLAIIIAVLGFAVGRATGHEPAHEATCESVKVNLTNYEGTEDNNLVTISIDGVTVLSEYFNDTTSFTAASPDTTKSHTYAIVIDANLLTGDPVKYDRPTAEEPFTGTMPACAAPTTSSTAPETTTTLPAPTTTTDIGEPPTVPPAVTIPDGAAPQPHLGEACIDGTADRSVSYINTFVYSQTTSFTVTVTSADGTVATSAIDVAPNDTGNGSYLAGDRIDVTWQYAGQTHTESYAPNDPCYVAPAPAGTVAPPVTPAPAAPAPILPETGTTSTLAIIAGIVLLIGAALFGVAKWRNAHSALPVNYPLPGEQE